MAGRSFFALSLLAISALDFVAGARILAVCPTASISHQVVIRGLAVALNERGHDLVVVTTNPLNDPNRKNYTEIDLSSLYNKKIEGSFIDKRGTADWNEAISYLEPGFNLVSEMVLSNPEFKKLYDSKSDEKFDLVLLEMFLLYILLPLGVRFNAPIIGIATTGLSIDMQYVMGNPIFPSHPSHWELETKNFGSFVPWERLNNFVRAWRYVYFIENTRIPKHEEIAKKYFGNDIPSLRELQRNVSLIFVNQQLPISFPRPNLPNIIEINGFHITKDLKPLPGDLQTMLDEATQGFIYMSLGSNVKSTMLSAKHRNAFITAFSKLPYKIIWKFEEDDFPDKPDNVKILKWTPQEAILAHPNIKLFIYQGGLQSTEEAITHAVPLIGLPVFGDQDAQVNKMVSVGVARKLEITTINKNDLLEAINDVITDSGYKQRMLNLRSLMKDRPHDLLENAIWWTEHVIRHRGAPYLRSSFADEPWYQRQNMDIIAFLSAGSMIIFFVILIILRTLLYKVVGVLTTQSSKGEKKDN